jgi:hypothetical protein
VYYSNRQETALPSNLTPTSPRTFADIMLAAGHLKTRRDTNNTQVVTPGQGRAVLITLRCWSQSWREHRRIRSKDIKGIGLGAGVTMDRKRERVTETGRFGKLIRRWKAHNMTSPCLCSYRTGMLPFDVLTAHDYSNVKNHTFMFGSSNSLLSIFFFASSCSLACYGMGDKCFLLAAGMVPDHTRHLFRQSCIYLLYFYRHCSINCG